MCCFFFFKQKTAYEMRISDWSSDVCSSDLEEAAQRAQAVGRCRRRRAERRAFHVTDVAVGLALHPGPAVALVEDAQRLAVEELGVERRAARRLAAQGGDAAGHAGKA